MVKLSGLSDFNMADELKTKEDMLVYLNMVIQENNPAEFVNALGVIVRSKDLSEITETSPLKCQALYEALCKEASPSFDTVNQLLNALGFRLTVSVT